MADWLYAAIVLSAGAPLLRAAWSNRRTSLAHAAIWANAAWSAWVVALAIEASGAGDSPRLRYVALCLTGCAAVAVLGARRPGVLAWDLVVTGLLAVLLLPLAEGFLSGGPWRLDGTRAVLAAGVISIGVLNYLPTRLSLAAALLGFSTGVVAWDLVMPLWPSRLPALARLMLGLASWAGWAARPGAADGASEADRLWRDFRDRFGLVWGQRLREQFNNAAGHAGWPVSLHWRGVRRNPGAGVPEPGQAEAVVATLQALMKRFGTG